MKALSIIGIIASVLFIAWILLAIDSAGRISMQEGGPYIIIFGMYTMALSIVGLITRPKSK